MRRHFERFSHVVTLAFILLHCLDATAAAGDNVSVLTPLTKTTSSVDELRDLCQGPGRYDACTRMIAYRLEAHCAPRGDAWTLDATARFRPWIFLHNPQRLTHEKEHVEDIRRSAERYVLGLESLTFASRAACESRGLAERAAFEMNMAGFALESNLARHPQLRTIARR
jgi:hypothetical protein